jgi:hypothetical protein
VRCSNDKSYPVSILDTKREPRDFRSFVRGEDYEHRKSDLAESS